MLLKKNIPFKYVIGKIKTELMLVSIYVVGVCVIYDVLHIKDVAIPLAVPMIMGTVISLLLAFRSNQAYDRWWEARTIWGAIVNDSRSLARQVNSFAPDAEQDDPVPFFRARFIKRQIAWCYSLSKALRGQDSVQGIEKFLSRADIQHIRNFSNTPMAILDVHGRELQRALQNGWINSYQQVELDRTLSKLSDSMGKCERIKNTIFPATYSLYIHFSLIFFFLLLPFALIETFGFMSIPVVIAIAAAFFLIEKMAIHLQDPFENKPTDTPMTAICATIERDLKQSISDPAHYSDLVSDQLAVNEKYYIL